MPQCILMPSLSLSEAYCYYSSTGCKMCCLPDCLMLLALTRRTECMCGCAISIYCHKEAVCRSHSSPSYLAVWQQQCNSMILSELTIRREKSFLDHENLSVCHAHIFDSLNLAASREWVGTRNECCDKCVMAFSKWHDLWATWTCFAGSHTWSSFSVGRGVCVHCWAACDRGFADNHLFRCVCSIKTVVGW